MSPSISGIVRTILSALGAYLLGRSVFGHSITADLWESLLGAVMAVSSIIWSWRSKILTAESIQGLIRQAITAIFGFLVAFGISIDANILVLILAVVGAIFPAINAAISRHNAAGLKAGRIDVAELHS